MSVKDIYDTPNDDSPTLGIELAIDSAREDIIAHVTEFAVIILLVEGHFIVGSLLAIYWVAQSIYAFRKELMLRAWRAGTNHEKKQTMRKVFEYDAKEERDGQEQK